MLRKVEALAGYRVQDMASITQSSLQEHEVVLTLVATVPLSREELEALTLHAEGVLVDKATDIALGASAAANFRDNSIEVDFVVSAASPAEIYEQVGRVMRILQEAGFQSEPQGFREAPPLRLASSATHEVAVCA